MELDDLKHTWKQADKNQLPANKNIMELIHHKSTGPVARLKKAFRRQALIVPVLAAIVTNNVITNPRIYNSVLFWSYITFCVALCIFFYLNYRLVSKMDGMDGMIKANLQQQVFILEKRLQWHRFGVGLMMLVFIAMLEVLPYFQHGSMLAKWHSVLPIYRILLYTSFIGLKYFLFRFLSHRKYGKHIAYLKELLKQME